MGTRLMTPRGLGVHAEGWAAWFYRVRGYRVLGRNIRTRYGELDLIVRRGGMLVFVEVKARQSLTAGEGLEAVTPAKQRRIEQLAAAWLVRNPHQGPMRYDVLSMKWNGWRFRVTHVKDAWGW